MAPDCVQSMNTIDEYFLSNFVCPFLLTSHFYFFFFNDTATTEIYTLSLHDALPISQVHQDQGAVVFRGVQLGRERAAHIVDGDRKSTRLNSSHLVISYAVFCLKKKRARPGASADSPACDCVSLMRPAPAKICPPLYC